MKKEYNTQSGNIGEGGAKMGKEYYSSGEVARKFGLSRREVTYRAAKGRLPQISYLGHHRYPRGAIDKMAEGCWPPVRFSLKDGVLEIELRGLATEPFRLAPCPGELPEINAPELHLPAGPTLPAWHLPRVASPFEVAERLRQHLWG